MCAVLKNQDIFHLETEGDNLSQKSAFYLGLLAGSSHSWDPSA